VPELQLLKGPLSADLLAEVAALYGVTDGKYGSVEHCDLLFNQNPFGPALHAFARQGDQAVGHYCLIPYDMRVDAGLIRAAKGEALHVAEDHRRSQCEGMPTSSALLEGAQRLAQQENIEISYAVVGAPGVIRLFERCGYIHQPFIVRDLLVPRGKALPLPRLAAAKVAEWKGRLSKAGSLRLKEVSFEAVRSRLPLELVRPAGAWEPVLHPETLEWFGKAPSNRYFQFGQGIIWVAQTHQDWEVLCTFTKECTAAERTLLAAEVRQEATRRGIDRIRVPFLQGIEHEMLGAFARLARREVDREISLVVRSQNPLGPASARTFLWAHF
jgi:hypothetical protein